MGATTQKCSANVAFLWHLWASEVYCAPRVLSTFDPDIAHASKPRNASL